ncbi:Dbl homology domain-containing protein [Schizopora paradoxa]|uniref:Dbl homology domain-containing protein n=1 Tax=Schizopora paradoxa TaxID=27342 RepID=A0A0H2RRA4_9AGAM|nr:Dbl homology domain-containing protein [Schizopora paradoxa]
MQRQEVIHELCESERLFVGALGKVLEVYVHPLLDENRRWMAGVPSLAANLLDWLDDIFQLHAQICSTLDHVQSTQVPIVTSIAAPLRHFVSRLEVYQPYICRLDEAVELIEDAMGDPKSDFGEFLRLQNPGTSPSESELSSSLWLPLARLGHYLDLFNTLWTLTPRHHPDYLPTYSLLTSVTLVVRVLREVKSREDEYTFVKGLVSRIRGLHCLDDVVRRQRRLRAHGPLYLLSSGTADDNSDSPNDNLPSSRNRDRIGDPRKQRRATSLDSGLSSASSVSSIVSSASSTCLNNGETISSRRHRHQTPPHARIYAFVFDDLVLITHQSQRNNVNGEDTWELASEIGVCRVLSLNPHPDDRRSFCLHLYPVEQNVISTGITPDSSSFYVTMRVPSSRRFLADPSNTDVPHESETFDLWWRAFQRCCLSSIRSLSMPLHSGTYLLDGLSAEDNNTSNQQTVMSLVASGLPIPKSPSLQLAEPQTTRSLAEREERGWWSLRFHEVLRELQSREALLSEMDCQPRFTTSGTLNV